MDRIRDVAYGGDSQKVIDKWPMEVREIINTNLQALQNSKVSSFSDLPDWVNQGSASEKALKGHDLKGARQLTINTEIVTELLISLNLRTWLLFCIASKNKQKDGNQRT